MAGEREEDVVERRSAQPDVVDLDPVLALTGHAAEVPPTDEGEGEVAA